MECEWCKKDLKTKKQKEDGVCNKECARFASKILFDDPAKAAKFALKPEDSDELYLHFSAFGLTKKEIKRILRALNKVIGVGTYNFFIEDQAPDEEPPNLEKELADLLNRYAEDNPSGTPDFILADYLLGCLRVYNATIQSRAKWRGESVQLPTLMALQNELREN